MSEIWGIILTALLSALVGAIGGSWAVNKSAATKNDIECLQKMLDEYRTERDQDRKEIEELKKGRKADSEEIAYLTEEVNELREYMEKRGLTPPPRKPRRKPEQSEP